MENKPFLNQQKIGEINQCTLKISLIFVYQRFRKNTFVNSRPKSGNHLNSNLNIIRNCAFANL